MCQEELCYQTQYTRLIRTYWLLHHFVLRIYQKNGTSKAGNVVEDAKNGWRTFALNYSHLTCIVTDTEATMIAAGKVFITNSTRMGGDSSWQGYIDHLL